MTLKFVLRSLRRSPRLSLAVIFCMALGMAATAAVATLIDLTMFRTAPFPDADRFVRIWNAERGSDDRDELSYRDFVDLRERLTSLDALEGAARARLIWHRTGEIGRRVEGEAVTPGYFELLGVQPYLGRMISREEHARGDAVMLLSWRTWGRAFNYDEGVLGQPVRVSYQIQGDSAVYTIVGVLPPDFAGTTEDDMPDLEYWIPLSNYIVGDAREQRSVRPILALGRLTPGAAVSQAQAQADALNAALEGEFDGFASEHTFNVEVFGTNWRSPFQAASATFGVAALLLLATAIVNIALLLLARALERRQEFAVRGALGAGRRQLVGQVLLETLLLAFVGGCLGVLTAPALLEFFLGLADVAVPEYLNPGPAPATLALTFVILVAAGCAAAMLPAWFGARVGAAEALSEGSAKLAGSGSSGRLSARLVGVQLALTLMLVAAAALLGRSWLSLGNADLGFATEERLRMALFVNGADVAEEDALPAFYERLESRLQAQPGVQAVGLVWPTVPMPVSPAVGRLRHAAVQTAEPEGLRVGNYIVGDSFFETLEIPIAAGRRFDGRESALEVSSAIVSSSLADELGGESAALNQIVLLNDSEYRIVGVAADARFGGPLEGPVHRHEIYLSLRQEPRRIVSPIVQVAGPPARFSEPLMRVLADLAPNSAIDWVDSVDGTIASLYRDSAFRLAIVAAFGISALLLALVGLYAVLSQQVVRATGEIGIRKSMGATDGRIQRDVLLRGLRTVITGLLAGMLASLAFARILGSLLHGVAPYDPAAFGAAGGILLLTAIIACWLPARRAAQMDPMVALRHE